LDLGEIIRNHIYVREIQALSTKTSEKCLLASKELYNKLTKIYDLIGVKKPEDQEVSVKIKLPLNPNPEYSQQWHESSIRTTDTQPVILNIDSFARYYCEEVVLASDKWLCEYDSFPGDKVILSPQVPVPRKLNEITSNSSLDVYRELIP